MFPVLWSAEHMEAVEVARDALLAERVDGRSKATPDGTARAAAQPSPAVPPIKLNGRTWIRRRGQTLLDRTACSFPCVLTIAGTSYEKRRAQRAGAAVSATASRASGD